MDANIDKTKIGDSRLASNNDGIVAIFSVLIIMGILGLLTLGFSSVIRQAQKRTLDEHLNNQAFYAAESGVNMAINKIETSPASIVSKPDCKPEPSDDYTIDPANNISVSCLTIDTTVPDIINSSINSDGIVTEAKVSAPASKLEVDWDSAVSNRDSIPSTYPSLPDKAAWGNNVGILKLELIPANVSLVRGVITDKSYTLYLYPSTGGTGSTTVRPDDKGTIVEARCQPSGSGYRCGVKLDLNDSAGNSFSDDKFYIRQSSIYRDISSSLMFRSALNNPLTIEGAQASVDSTGKANDIMQRIQVRVPLSKIGSSSTVYSPYAIFSGDRICKLYSMTGRTSGQYVDNCSNSPTGTVTIP